MLTDEDIYTSTSTAPVGGGGWKLTIKPIKALSQTETEGGWGGAKSEKAEFRPCYSRIGHRTSYKNNKTANGITATPKPHPLHFRLARVS